MVEVQINSHKGFPHHRQIFLNVCRIRGSHSGGYKEFYPLVHNGSFLADSLLLVFAWFSLEHLRLRRHAPPKCQLNFNRQHGIISRKTELFNIKLSNYYPKHN
jgi:hypothetical protein